MPERPLASVKVPHNFLGIVWVVSGVVGSAVGLYFTFSASLFWGWVFLLSLIPGMVIGYCAGATTEKDAEGDTDA